MSNTRAEGLSCRLRLILGAAVAILFAVVIPVRAQDLPREASKVWPYLSTLPAAERKSVTEREACREGSLVLYGATGLDRANFWIGEFNKRYPDIKVEFVRLLGSELYEKVASERRTGRIRADLIITTITYVDLLSTVDAFAPYETTHWPDFDKRFLFGGRDKDWTAVVFEIFPHAIAFRTDRVSSAEAPRSLEALIDPRWKGRMGTTMHLEDFLNGLFSVIGDETGRVLVKKLSTLENRLYRSHAALSDALASGAIDIAWGLIAARPIDLKKKGAPVDWAPENPLLAEGNTISVVRDTQRPYAAALFVDVMLSPETLQVSDAWQGGRIFGNTKGKFMLSLDQYQSLFIFPPLSKERYGELNKLAEQLFVR